MSSYEEKLLTGNNNFKEPSVYEGPKNVLIKCYIYGITWN